MPITTIKELLADTEGLEKFKNSSSEGRVLALETLSESFKTGSEGARELVMNRLLSTPVNDDVPPAWKDVPLEALKNIPSSSVDFARNIYQAVRHPIQTGKALGTVALGGVQKLIPGEQASEQTFDTMVDFFKERYGGDENLRRTISEDPIGFLTDVSAVAGGAGAALSVTGKVSKVGALTKAGQVVSKGVLADPVLAAGKGAAKLASGGVPRIAKSFAKTGLKPSASAKLTEAQRLTKVDALATEFVERGMKLNRKEIARLGEGIEKAQNNIKNIIEEGTKAKIKIKTSDIVNSLDDLITELDDVGLKTQDITRNIKLIERIKADTLKNSPEFLTPTQVQKFKVFQNKKFTPNTQVAIDAVRKTANDKLRATTKQILEDKFPSLKGLNADQGIMIELQEAIAKRIKGLEGQKTIGVTGLVAGGGGAAAGGLAAGTAGATIAGTFGTAIAFGAGAVLVERVITSPKIQLIIARALNQANKVLAKSGKLGKVTQPVFQAGRIAGEVEGINPPVQ